MVMCSYSSGMATTNGGARLRLVCTHARAAPHGAAGHHAARRARRPRAGVARAGGRSNRAHLR